MFRHPWVPIYALRIHTITKHGSRIALLLQMGLTMSEQSINTSIWLLVSKRVDPN